MCLYGVYKKVKVINPNQSKKHIFVDACIADEIQELNDKGVITLGCCCGHGKAGEISKWENAFGKWKAHFDPPHSLIHERSVEKAKRLGYRPFPYYYADGLKYGVWQMFLMTGCLTIEDCRNWHKEHDLQFKKHLGDLTGS